MAYQTSTSERAELAKKRLETRFSNGQQKQDALLEQVAAMHIRDKLVAPTKLIFQNNQGSPRVYFGGVPLGLEAGHTIHTHALGQMCATAGISKTYVNRLLHQKSASWENALFDHNMNELFHKGKYLDRSKQPTKFLVRLVGREIRGFLSRNFNRHLASLPLLRGFVHACDKVGAQPVEAHTTAVRFSLKCYLPHIFEPVPGEFVAFGEEWSNSDFGAGRLKVSFSTMRISSGATAVMDDVMSRVHIGSVIQESDIELSSNTLAKEVETQVSAIEDAVVTHLAPEKVNKMIDIIAAAHEEQIPWRRLRSELGRLLQKAELEQVQKILEGNGDDIIDLPPPGQGADGSPIPTRWWASNVVSWMASRENNTERKGDLEGLAGSIISKTKGTAA